MHASRITTLALMLLASCGGSSSGSSTPGDGSSDGSLVLEITDAPIDPALIQRAAITVDRLQLLREGDPSSRFITIYEGEPIQFDLTMLRNGITQRFAVGNLEPGSYTQARMRVFDALVELKDGRRFSTRADTIQMNSQDRSGFKVFFDPAIQILEGVEARMLMDFQLDRCFSPIPAGNMENARKFMLHPSVRTANLQETGELRGTVETMNSEGDRIAALATMVYVVDPGTEDMNLALASTLTGDDGTAAILGLPVGTYDVVAVQGDRIGRTTEIEIVKDTVTDFSLLVE